MSKKDEYIEKQKAWMARYYGQLEGATINQFVIGIDPEFGEMFPMFEVTLKNSEKVEIQIYQDEEGNGPGFINGLELNPGQKTTPREEQPEYQTLQGMDVARDHKPELTRTKDGRLVTAVKISDSELIHVGGDPDNKGKYRIDLLELNTEDAEPLYTLSGLELDEMRSKTEGLINGTEGVKEKLLLEHAGKLLEEHGGEMWHSGGGIMLIARHIGEIRITAAPDEGASTFGVEVTDDDGDVLSFKDGLDSNGLVDEWKKQVKKHS